jgi:hypothetical protein
MRLGHRGPWEIFIACRNGLRNAGVIVANARRKTLIRWQLPPLSKSPPYRPPRTGADICCIAMVQRQSLDRCPSVPGALRAASRPRGARDN